MSDELQTNGTHPDLETLSAHEAGDGDDATRRHVDGCPQCQEHVAAISSLRVDLASLPQPAMPADVVARVERALAAAQTPAGATVLPLGEARNRRRFSTRISAAGGVAAGVLALLGAVLVAGHFAGGGGASTAGDLAAGGSSRTAVTVTTSGITYTPDRQTLRTVVPALLSHSDDAIKRTATDTFAEDSLAGTAGSGGKESTSEGPTAGQPAPQTAAGTAAVPNELNARRLSKQADVRALVNDSEAVRQCALTLTDLALAPLAVDIGNFGGRPVAAFVFARTDSATQVDLYLVRPRCGPTDIALYVPRLPRA